MRFYELAYLLLPTSTQEDIQMFLQKLISSVESKEGIFVSQVQPTKRQLAYPIKKRGSTHQSAYFGTLHFYLDENEIPELLKTLRAQALLIRFLLCRETQKGARAPIPQVRRQRPSVFPEKPKAFAEAKPFPKDFAPAKPLPKEQKVELEKLEEKLEELLK